MRYGIKRKINLGKYHPHFQYESVDFEVTDASSKKEAETELKEWIDEYKKELGNAIKKTASKKDAQSPL